MSRQETFKRYLVFSISLFFSGLGVAVAKHSDLGVSPISSVPNIINIRFPQISIGTLLIIWNCMFVAAEIIMLRRRFKPIQLLQIPIAFGFGIFTDLGTLIADLIPTDTYIMQLVTVFLGIAILAFGIALSFMANVVMNPGEAIVKTISVVTNKNLGNVKIIFDVSSVTLSIILSLIFFDFTIVGTREGTILSAVGTGLVVKLYCRLLQKHLERFFSGKNEEDNTTKE